MTDKTKRTPIIDPLLLALKSRRVIIALVTVVIGALMLAVPGLAAVQSELLVLLLTVALAVIGGYSLEDAAIAARQTPVLTDDLKQQLRDLIDAVLDEITAEG